MKYMCMECRRIHEYLDSARQCCQPCVEPIEDDRVAPCQDGGADCGDPDCPFCQGTGLMLKPAPKVQTLKR